MNCRFCKEPLRETEAIELAGQHLHPVCYTKVAKRIVTFLNVLMLPDEDFDEWLGLDEGPIHLPCSECGSDVQEVRPGKWQCPNCE